MMKGNAFSCADLTWTKWIFTQAYLREHGGDRVGETGQAVDAGDQDVGHAAALQVGQAGEPKLGPFVLLEPQAHSSLRPAIHAQGDVNGPLRHGPSSLRTFTTIPSK